jgi:hypothetical protein
VLADVAARRPCIRPALSAADRTRPAGVRCYRKRSRAGVRCSGAASAARPATPTGPGGRGAAPGRRSWPAAPAPGLPRFGWAGTAAIRGHGVRALPRQVPAAVGRCTAVAARRGASCLSASCMNRFCTHRWALVVALDVDGGSRASEVKQPGRVAPLNRGAGLLGHPGRPDPLLLEDGVKDRSA